SRRHTRFSRDWSSDVCSSDLPRMEGVIGRGPRLFRFDAQTGRLYRAYAFPREAYGPDSYFNDVRVDHRTGTAFLTDSNEGGIVELGRASCRERVETHVGARS